MASTNPSSSGSGVATAPAGSQAHSAGQTMAPTGVPASSHDRAAAADTVGHWIDGRPFRGHGRALDVFNPATGAV
jgi:hypothetical protein